MKKLLSLLLLVSLLLGSVALLARLPRKVQPAFERQHWARVRGDLPRRFAHIAHAAGEVAHRRKLERTAKGEQRAARFAEQELCQRRFISYFFWVHVGHPFVSSALSVSTAALSGVQVS